MRITKHGHACLHVETGQASLLLDPGVFSSGFEELTGLDGILVTHQHADHVTADALGALVAQNPQAVLVVDPDTARELDLTDAHVLTDGEELTIAGTTVRGVGSRHAVIHPDLPGISNTGYLVGGRLLHPGDALTVPDLEVELLAVPLMAPWQKLSETVDWVRAVRPRVAFPVHDGLVRPDRLGVFDGNLARLSVGDAYRRIDDEPLDLD